jgi:1-phosphatidylinositol-4-phosphate 5-kinase
MAQALARNNLGRPIGQQHKNYKLMRHMQFGIRHGVTVHANCHSALMDRQEAFDECKTKYLFPVGSGEDEEVEFTDYAPMCFLKLREFFGIDEKEYIKHICDSTWTESTAGKSSALLYFAGNSFVIKTTNSEESKFLRQMMYGYYEHCQAYPLTLIPHFFGHHAIKIPGRRKLRFVIMKNVFHTTNKIHIKYDLKGSTVGRAATDKEKERSSCILKDNDMDINRDFMRLGARKEILIRQIQHDTKFLADNAVMDYSFLLGIHNLSDQSNDLAQAQLTIPDRIRALPEYCFVSDMGGMQKEPVQGPTQVYYFGIIDILQEYTLRKRGETMLRSVQHGKSGISAVPPDFYAERFRRYMGEVMI